MSGEDLLVRLVVAAALGFAVGLERQLGRHPEEGYAGARTFTLAGLLGGLTAAIAAESAAVGAVAVAVFGAVLVGSYLVSTLRSADAGTTTELAEAVVFALGFVVYRGLFTVAIAVTVIVLVVLRAKPTLYATAERFSDADVRTVLQFAVVSAVILPFVPDEGFGPAAAVNPHEIWLMVVLVSAIGLTGYVALRFLGPRGLVATGLLGGLVSSTAVALSFGRHSRTEPRLAPALAVAVLAGSGLMYARVWVEAFLVAPTLAGRLAAPMGLLFVGVEAAAVALFFLGRGRSLGEETTPPAVPLRNPTSFATALQFGALYGLVVVAGRLLVEQVSSGSLVALGAAAGITDVDAITLTAANLVGDGLEVTPAARAVVAAVAVNSAVKAVIVGVVGGREMTRRVAPVLGSAALVASAWLAG